MKKREWKVVMNTEVCPTLDDALIIKQVLLLSNLLLLRLEASAPNVEQNQLEVCTFCSASKQLMTKENFARVVVLLLLPPLLLHPTAAPVVVVPKPLPASVQIVEQNGNKAQNQLRTMNSTETCQISLRIFITETKTISTISTCFFFLWSFTTR